MKLVVLDDQNIVFLPGESITKDMVWAMQESFLERLPGWNVIVIGGSDGEVVDLRDRPEIAERGKELFGLIKDAMEETV